ncbi:MAG: hypothetical protein QXU97_04575 [Fervidicoccaceae archaeon]
MRVFFATDVHGSSLVWRKWLRSAEVYGADVLVMAGDLTGKVLVPIVKRGDEYHARYFGRKWRLRGEAEVSAFEERLEGAGAYYVRVTDSELEELRSKPELVEKLMHEKIVERLRLWLEQAVEKARAEVRVVVMPGNDDDFFVDEVLREFEDRVTTTPLGGVEELGGHEILSSPYVNPTPWRTPREMAEEELEKHLRALASELDRPERAVFNLHCPPHGTNLDIAPKLDRSLRPVVIGGVVLTEHVGSVAVRRVLEDVRPLVGLHGHIHESSGVDRVGGTVVLNPGSEYSEGILRGYVVELRGGELGGYWRVEG